MQVQFYKALWGMPETVPAAIQKIHDAGFDGIEAPLGQIRAVRDAGFTGPVIPMLFGDNPATLAEEIEACKAVRPTKITIHAGTERMDVEAGKAFFAKLLPSVKDSGLEVNFETHRGRLLYEPIGTAKLLQEFPDLFVCADLSHWTVVCGNMLDGYGTELPLVYARTRHIHARVGHTEGPQVPDPRAAYWSGAVDKFFTFWEGMKAAAEKRGDTVLTIDPEFGPPNYLWTNPKDGQPLADLWDVCVWTRDEIKRRWVL